jgi:hypothetical protein
MLIFVIFDDLVKNNLNLARMCILEFEAGICKMILPEWRNFAKSGHTDRRAGH